MRECFPQANPYPEVADVSNSHSVDVFSAEPVPHLSAESEQLLVLQQAQLVVEML